MYLGLLVPFCRERPHLAAAASAALLSVVFSLAGAGRWSVILATIPASALGLLLLPGSAEGGGSPAGRTAP
jgi:predicted branched-subunit amino acid permease